VKVRVELIGECNADSGWRNMTVESDEDVAQLVWECGCQVKDYLLRGLKGETDGTFILTVAVE